MSTCGRVACVWGVCCMSIALRVCVKGTSSSTYLISKVLFFNITQKFTNLLVQLSIFLIDLLVQLSIFLIDLFVGTYRLSSHARLEAFVTQTKLNMSIALRVYVLGAGPGKDSNQWHVLSHHHYTSICGQKSVH